MLAIAAGLKNRATYLLALEGAPVLDVIDGKCVGSLWVRHFDRCEIELGIRRRRRAADVDVRGADAEGQLGVFESLLSPAP